MHSDSDKESAWVREAVGLHEPGALPGSAESRVRNAYALVELLVDQSYSMGDQFSRAEAIDRLTSAYLELSGGGDKTFIYTILRVHALCEVLRAETRDGTASYPQRPPDSDWFGAASWGALKALSRAVKIAPKAVTGDYVYVRESGLAEWLRSAYISVKAGKWNSVRKIEAKLSERVAEIDAEQKRILEERAEIAKPVRRAKDQDDQHQLSRAALAINPSRQAELKGGALEPSRTIALQPAVASAPDCTPRLTDEPEITVERMAESLDPTMAAELVAALVRLMDHDDPNVSSRARRTIPALFRACRDAAAEIKIRMQPIPTR